MLLLRQLVLCGNKLTYIKHFNSSVCVYKPHVKVSIQTRYGLSIQLQSCKRFHTTTPKCAVPPIIWIILRPVLKVGAIVFGRRIRKWWQGLSAKERQNVLSTVRQGNRTIVVWFCHVVWDMYITTAILLKILLQRERSLSCSQKTR